MRIVSLHPSLTELVVSLGLESSLVGCTHQCRLPDDVGADSAASGGVRRVTADRPEQIGADAAVDATLSPWPFDLQLLQELAPDRILTLSSAFDPRLKGAEEKISLATGAQIGTQVRVTGIFPRRLEEVYESFVHVATALKCAEKGRDLSGRLKAQLMNWADNFYDRMKNKKVTFLSSVDPLMLGGYWIPDLIHLFSGHSHHTKLGEGDSAVAWDEIIAFRPDVIVVAPRNMAVEECLKLFKRLEKLTGWEDIPAVKRGEVVFCPGQHSFYNPSMKLIDGAAFLVSAIAGFESGYITERDSFFRLRWLELQRHRF